MAPRLIVALLLLLQTPLLAQSLSNETRQKILTAQDLRDVKALNILLRDSRPATRAKAAFAAGSVQDTSLIARLAWLLNDEDSNVRSASAFALGQMNFVVDSVQRRSISAALIKRFGQEIREAVQVRIIEGLGKTGDSLSLDALMKYMTKSGLGASKGEAALSVGRYGYRGIKNPAAANFAATVLADGKKSEKWKAAYAMFRIGEKSLLDPHARTLTHAASDKDPDVRMYVATALGKALTAPNLEPLVSLAGSDPDWRVRVNALKALAAFDMPSSSGLATTIVMAFNDSNEHISLAALSAVGSKDAKQFDDSHPIIEALKRIVSNESSRYSWRQQREAAISIAKLRGENSYEMLFEQVNRGRLLKNSYVEALGVIPTESALREVIEYTRQGDPRTQRLAMESVLSIAKNIHLSTAMLRSTKTAIGNGLSSNDAAVITVAAGALVESLFVDYFSVSNLLGALQRLKSADNAEAMGAIIQSLAVLKADGAVATLTALLRDKDRSVALEAATALEKITGSSYKQLLPPQAGPAHTDFNWVLLEWIRKHPTVEVRTSRGTFTLALLTDEAPFTCINFATLIRKGFFNGLPFHRVVPNFVVQGGDPHGDGWGGPGYAIRSEFGYEHYKRGMAGVASSGKDTEGSQFFVTHSNQPHLDCRYTIFGRVTAGMDVIDAMQVGDRIEVMKFPGSVESPN